MFGANRIFRSVSITVFQGRNSMTRRVLSFMAAMVLAAIPALAQDPGWIGISIEDQKEAGAIVRQIEPNSPAERAGLKEGDVITEFNRQPVVGVQQLTRLVRE